MATSFSSNIKNIFVTLQYKKVPFFLLVSWHVIVNSKPEENISISEVYKWALDEGWINKKIEFKGD